MECNVSTQQGAFELEVTLSLPASTRWLGVIGASGAGKSTFLDALAGFNKSARVQGHWQNLVLGDTENLVMVSAQTPLFPGMSVTKNLELVALHNRQSSKLTEVIALCECGELLEKHPTDLSGGELQRIKLARALVANPELLLLDESFSAMDKALRQRILLRLKNVLSANVKVIMVSHDIDDLLLTCEQLCVIEHGRCVISGGLLEVVDSVSMLASNVFPPGSILTGRVVAQDESLLTLDTGTQQIRIRNRQHQKSGSMLNVLLPASKVTLALPEQKLVKTNCITGTIISITQYDKYQSGVTTECAGQRVLALIDSDLLNNTGLKSGDVVNMWFDTL